MMNTDAPIAGEPAPTQPRKNQPHFAPPQSKANPPQQRQSRRATALSVVQTLMLILALSLSTYAYASIDSMPEQIGTDGTNTSEMLVRTEGRVADSICTEGGAELFLGNDLNDNGYLDEQEITSSTKICHGKEGLSGPQGAHGAPGDDAAGMLETVELEPGSTECSQGGMLIHSGTDHNSNGQLDESEREASTPVCDGRIGSDGNDGLDGNDGAPGVQGASALVEQVRVPASVCSSGIMLNFGIDDGQFEGTAFDGVLHDDEIRSSIRICNSPLQFGPISDFASGIADGVSPNCDALVWMQQQQQILMAGVNGINGCELWVSDGTEASTQLLLDINPSGDSLPGQYLGLHAAQTQSGERIFFDADDGINGRELWVSDGTMAGTQQLHSNDQSITLSSSSNIVSWKEGVVVSDASGDLYWCDATTIHPLFEHPMFSNEAQQLIEGQTLGMSALGSDMLYANEENILFSGHISGDVEPHMLQSDGTLTSWNVYEQGSSDPSAPLMFNETVIVVAESQQGRQLVQLMDDGTFNWLTSLQNQGTGSPTTHVAEHLGIHLVHNTLVFDALTSGVDAQAWAHDLASGTTQMLSTNIVEPGDRAGGIVHDERLWFDCVAPQVAHELCSTDGTMEGTRVETDLRPGIASSEIVAFASHGDTLFFIASGTIDGFETGSSLWYASSGDVGLAYDPWPGVNNNSGSGTYGELVCSEHHILFASHDGSRGHEIHAWSHGALTEEWLIW